jgi:hypothetical protein
VSINKKSRIIKYIHFIANNKIFYLPIIITNFLYQNKWNLPNQPKPHCYPNAAHTTNCTWCTPCCPNSTPCFLESNSRRPRTFTSRNSVSGTTCIARRIGCISIIIRASSSIRGWRNPLFWSRSKGIDSVRRLAGSGICRLRGKKPGTGFTPSSLKGWVSKIIQALSRTHSSSSPKYLSYPQKTTTPHMNTPSIAFSDDQTANLCAFLQIKARESTSWTET